MSSPIESFDADEIRETLRLTEKFGRVGFWKIDVETESLFWSEEVFHIHGRDPSAGAPPLETAIEYYHPDDVDRVNQAVATALASGQPFVFENARVIREDGDLRRVSSRGECRLGTDGSPKEIYGVFRDVTEEFVSRQEADETRKRLQLVVDSGYGVWEYDPAASTVTAYPELLSLLGIKADKPRVLPLEEFLERTPEEDRNVIRTALADQISGRRPYLVEHRAICEDGSIIWVRARGMASGGANGEPLKLVGAVEDISDLKTAEDELRLSNKRFDLAARGASVGIWDWIDVNSEEEYWSPIFFRLLGYEPGDIPASLGTFSELLHPDDSERTFAAVNAHFESRKPFREEYRLRTKEGGYRWFLGTGQADFGEDGKPTRMVGNIQDIHDRKEAEARLKAANQDLERFAYVASHDLQEPLRKVSQFASLLQENLGGKLDGENRIFLDYMIDGAERAKILVQNLLEFARTGSAALDCQKLSAGQLVASALDSLGLEAGRDLEIDIRGADQGVFGDPGLLNRLVQNLVSNSVKYRGEDLPRIVVTVDQGRDFTEIRFEDNGIGFPEEQAERIFEIFRRLHRRDEYPGTGLGLAIVRRIAEIHGGTVSARRGLRHGAVFTLRLPVVS